MLGNAFTGWHAIIILAVIILLFGAAKLPALARSVGQSAKIFKNEIKSGQDDADSTRVEQARTGSVAPNASDVSGTSDPASKP